MELSYSAIPSWGIVRLYHRMLMPPIFIFLLLDLFNHPAVNFINILHAHFLYKILVPKSLKAKTKLCNFWHQNVVQKTCAENIDEIDTWSVKSC